MTALVLAASVVGMDSLSDLRDYLESRRRETPGLHNVPIRMPSSMHMHLKLVAKERGESMNTIALMMLQRGYERLVQEWDAEETPDA